MNTFDTFKLKHFSKRNDKYNMILEGISETYNTPYKVSQLFDIDVSRITGFKIVGNNLYFRIRGNFTFPNIFLGAFTQVSEANQDIVKIINTELNAGAEQSVLFIQGRFAYKCPNIEEIILNGIITLHEASIAELPKLHRLELNNLTNLGNQAIRDLPLIEHLRLPSLSNMYGTNFFLRNMRGLRTLYAPLLNRGGDNFLDNSISLEYCNIKKMKSALGTSSFNNIKLNAVIDINIAMDSISNIGSYDNRLIYTHVNRDCTVNFYNDLGEYIYTMFMVPNTRIGGTGSTFNTKPHLLPNISNGQNIISDVSNENGDTIFYAHIDFTFAMTNNTDVTSFESEKVSSLANGTFVNCPNLKVFNCPNISTFGQGGSDKLSNTGIITLNFPNFTDGYWSNLTGNRNPELESIIMPNALWRNTGNYVFMNNPKLRLVDLRSMRALGRKTDLGLWFTNSGISGVTVLKVNQGVLNVPEQSGGGLDSNVDYVKNTRGWIVELYDDDGNYVSTL